MLADADTVNRLVNFVQLKNTEAERERERERERKREAETSEFATQPLHSNHLDP